MDVSVKRNIEQYARGLGFYKIGVAECRPVDVEGADRYDRWISARRHAAMSYLEKYGDVRRDPRLLLDGARSIVMCAMSYYHALPADASPAMRSIAMYARGDDYHDIMRGRLEELGQFVKSQLGGEHRACVDTAPLRERYWAVEAGLGFIGLNNQLIIPGAGSYFFLGALLTTVEIEPDMPMRASCVGCGRCLRACPGRALDGEGGVDSSRCLSYLTIEHRGDFADDVDLKGHLYGCDECQRLCPYNIAAKESPVGEFAPRAAYDTLTPERVLELTQEEFSTIFRRSAIKRTKLAGLQRNAKKL